MADDEAGKESRVNVRERLRSTLIPTCGKRRRQCQGRPGGKTARTDIEADGVAGVEAGMEANVRANVEAKVEMKADMAADIDAHVNTDTDCNERPSATPTLRPRLRTDIAACAISDAGKPLRLMLRSSLMESAIECRRASQC